MFHAQAEILLNSPTLWFYIFNRHELKECHIASMFPLVVYSVTTISILTVVSFVSLIQKKPTTPNLFLQSPRKENFVCNPKEVEYGVKMSDVSQSHPNDVEDTPWLKENDCANEHNPTFITQVLFPST